MANGHGGRRDGAGRQAIPAGRRKQLPKASLADSANGFTVKSTKRQTPLQFLLTIMRDASADADLRLLCARTALPYVHAEKRHTEPATSKEKPLGMKSSRQERVIRSCEPGGKYAPGLPPLAYRKNNQ